MAAVQRNASTLQAVVPSKHLEINILLTPFKNVRSFSGTEPSSSRNNKKCSWRQFPFTIAIANLSAA